MVAWVALKWKEFIVVRMGYPKR